MARGLTTHIVAATFGVLTAGLTFAQTPPTQPPTTQQETTQPAGQGKDDASARQALLQAREALAELTKMPEASQLQGQERTAVSQLIDNFNSLLSAEANWYEHYRSVMQNVHTVIGEPDAGTSGSTTSGTSGTGTTGTTGSGTTAGTTSSTAAQVPAVIRTKLTEFRQHMMSFGRSAGAPDVTGGVSSSASGSSAAAGTAGSSTTGATTGTSGSGTTGTNTGAGTASTGADPAQAETIEQHINAINDILQQAMGTSSAAGSTSGTSGTGTTGTGGTTGTTGTGTTGSTTPGTMTTGGVTLDRQQFDRIQSHLQRVRELARQKGIK